MGYQISYSARMGFKLVFSDLEKIILAMELFVRKLRVKGATTEVRGLLQRLHQRLAENLKTIKSCRDLLTKDRKLSYLDDLNNNPLILIAEVIEGLEEASVFLQQGRGAEVITKFEKGYILKVKAAQTSCFSLSEK